MGPRRRWLSFACALGVMSVGVACSPGIKTLSDARAQARSQVAASSFVLQAYASGDSTGAFTTTSLREYGRGLGSTLRQIEAMAPSPERDATAASVRGARQAIDDARAALSVEYAREAVRVLDAAARDLAR